MITQIFHFNKYDLRSLKVTKGHLSFWEFKTILHKTFIYELILIKIYMKTIIMNTKIFLMTSKVIEGH